MHRPYCQPGLLHNFSFIFSGVAHAKHHCSRTLVRREHFIEVVFFIKFLFFIYKLKFSRKLISLLSIFLQLHLKNDFLLYIYSGNGGVRVMSSIGVTPQLIYWSGRNYMLDHFLFRQIFPKHM